MKVNLWDAAFAHLPYSVPGRVSKHIEWVRSRDAWDGITIFTDRLLRPELVEAVKSPIKLGWLLEGKAYGFPNYPAAEAVLRRGMIDLLLTHDADLLARYPDKARFVPFGGCWIPDEKWGMHPKTRDVSHIYSAKRFMRGHELRYQIADRFQQILDCYGHGTLRPLESKVPALAPYRFSIVVENDRAENYFTEKLIDCFAVGTIPIYWGCPNIGDFFDMEGIIAFDALNELGAVLHEIRLEDFVTFAEQAAAERNLIAARKYVLPEDYIYEHVLKGMEAK